MVIILTKASETVVQGPRRALDEPQVPGRVPDHRKLGPKKPYLAIFESLEAKIETISYDQINWWAFRDA